MRASEHPLYRDDAAVRAVTLEHVAAGRTIFQMFQFGASEAEHAEQMLEIVAPLPEGGSVLSLGCGVGGMERLWQLRRPDLSFELVNVSPAQLDLCACEGERVLADAEGYVSPRGPFDCVVLACMLGHVDVQATLASALRNAKAGGVLLVADCFNSSASFDSEMHYRSPSLPVVQAFGLQNAAWVETIDAGLRPHPWIKQTLPEIERATTPAVVVMGV